MANELPEDLINAQRAANAEHARLLELQDRFARQEGDDARVSPGAWTDEQRAEWDEQQQRWAALLPGLHVAVIAAAQTLGASRYEVEMAVKQAAKTEAAAA
ncbi:hypothetical protein OG747_36950 [Streptomyces sp. NBC_01384]|uniref:hypothetical protein n=1 Tax=Streptomyces sp. NBC_01384 TaxID=2903847 RepID=UPI0032513A40